MKAVINLKNLLMAVVHREKELNIVFRFHVGFTGLK